ncbi:MAG: hypothetical protein R6X31_13680, partial [Anaerolineae bacterium]
MDENEANEPMVDAKENGTASTDGESGKGSVRRPKVSVGGVKPDTLLARIGTRGVVLGIVALVVVAVLFVPPVSLLDRLAVVGYESLSAENPAVSHLDGLTLRV